jgi:hypothetical protein
LKPDLRKNIDTPYQPIKDRSKRAITISIFGLFIGFGLIILMYPLTLINFLKLTQLFIGFSVVGFLIPLKLYQRWFHFIKYEMILFNLMGIGPFFTALFLVLNFLFSSNPQTINYEIIGFEKSGSGIDLKLRSEIHEINPKITYLSEVNLEEFTFAKTIDITLADGLFGFKIIKDRTFRK